MPAFSGKNYTKARPKAFPNRRLRLAAKAVTIAKKRYVDLITIIALTLPPKTGRFKMRKDLLKFDFERTKNYEEKQYIT